MSKPVGMGYGRPWVDQWHPDPCKGFSGGGGRGEGGVLLSACVSSTSDVCERTVKKVWKV